MSSPTVAPKRLAFFERYLTVWVLVCMVVGIAFGKIFPGISTDFSRGVVKVVGEVNAKVMLSKYPSDTEWLGRCCNNST